MTLLQPLNHPHDGAVVSSELFPWEPSSPEAVLLMDLIAGDPIHQRDRQQILNAISEEAAAHGGLVNADRVRNRLSNEHGLTVYPRLIGPIYSHLARMGVLQCDSWTVSGDRRGGNAGKPARQWRLVLPTEANGLSVALDTSSEPSRSRGL